jgi:hypothetical protein
MIRAIPFEPWHLLALTRDTSDRAATQATFRQKCGIAYTAIDGDMILGCAGIVADHGVGGAWALLSEELKSNHKFWFLRTSRMLLDAAVKALKLQRIEALVNPTIKANCQWIEWVGFELEIVKRRAGEGGIDMLSYVLLPQVNHNE